MSSRLSKRVRWLCRRRLRILKSTWRHRANASNISLHRMLYRLGSWVLLLLLLSSLLFRSTRRLYQLKCPCLFAFGAGEWDTIASGRWVWKGMHAWAPYLLFKISPVLFIHQHQIKEVAYRELLVDVPHGGRQVISWQEAEDAISDHTSEGNCACQKDDETDTQCSSNLNCPYSFAGLDRGERRGVTCQEQSDGDGFSFNRSSVHDLILCNRFSFCSGARAWRWRHIRQTCYSEEWGEAELTGVTACCFSIRRITTTDLYLCLLSLSWWAAAPCVGSWFWPAGSRSSPRSRL